MKQRQCGSDDGLSAAVSDHLDDQADIGSSSMRRSDPKKSLFFRTIPHSPGLSLTTAWMSRAPPSTSRLPVKRLLLIINEEKDGGSSCSDRGRVPLNLL